MTRSSKKGPYVDERLLKKIEGKKPLETGVIKTWSRACVISPEMVGFTFGVHNGKTHLEVLVAEDMIGHRLGEFSPTKKFIKRLKAEAEKTKSSTTKENLIQQATDIDNEISAKQRESESYNQQAKVLQFQADSLKNSITLSNAMMTEIQSGPTSVSSSTSATQNSNAITGKSNETTNNTKSLNIQSSYVDVFVVQMRQAEKISDELERETQLSIIYQQWTDSLDQQIKVLRELLAVNKIEEEQKEIYAIYLKMLLSHTG
jgi:small subunit ribosomal protein S19